MPMNKTLSLQYIVDLNRVNSSNILKHINVFTLLFTLVNTFEDELTNHNRLKAALTNAIGLMNRLNSTHESTYR